MGTGEFYPLLLEAVVSDNVLPLGTGCNMACAFCSHRQNPPGLKVWQIPVLPLEQVTELAEFLDPARKIIIGESATRISEGEPFAYPWIEQVLELLRKRFPGTLISITTNGTLLDRERAGFLKQLMPLELTVSLNSSSAAGRRILLKDHQPERATRAIELLSALGIPFHGSLVAMPHLTGMEDVVNTIGFLTAAGARTVRLFLPGYTKYAKTELRFPLSAWPELVKLAERMTVETKTPVIAEPTPASDLVPGVYAVIRGSAADRCGILPGDTILSVNGKKPRSRVDAFQMVQKSHDPRLSICRDNKEHTFRLVKSAGEASGLVMHYDFSPERLDALERVLARHGDDALVLCSEFAYGLMKNIAGGLAVPVPNLFFGGSIRCAGLLTVEDMLSAARDALKKRSFKALVVPGEAFDKKGYDLTGRHVDELSSGLGQNKHLELLVL